MNFSTYFDNGNWQIQTAAPTVLCNCSIFINCPSPKHHKRVRKRKRKKDIYCIEAIHNMALNNPNQNLKGRRRSSENIGPNDRSKRSNVKENIMSKLFSFAFIKENLIEAVCIAIIVIFVIVVGVALVMSYDNGDIGRRLKGGEMNVYVSHAGEMRTVAVSADATVADVAEAAGLPRGTQLSFQGDVLLPGALLADAGVGAEGVLQTISIELTFATQSTSITISDDRSTAKRKTDDEDMWLIRTDDVFIPVSFYMSETPQMVSYTVINADDASISFGVRDESFLKTMPDDDEDEEMVGGEASSDQSVGGGSSHIAYVEHLSVQDGDEVTITFDSERIKIEISGKERSFHIWTHEEKSDFNGKIVFFVMLCNEQEIQITGWEIINI